MTQDEIIELARQAGFNLEFDDYVYEHWDFFKAFAKLVAKDAVINNNIYWFGEVVNAVAKEREACAQICDSVNSYDNPMTANDVADAIRARGQE